MSSILDLKPRTLRPGALNGPDQIMVRALKQDAQQWYFLYLPQSLGRSTPIFVSVHGVTRNVHEHAMLFMPWAERHGAIMIAPFFPEHRHRRYQRLGREREQLSADCVLNQIIDEVCQDYGVDESPLRLFGHSGGGQFVHRYMMKNPRRVAAVGIGAAGWYTFPDPALEYPYGIRPSANLALADPAEFLRVPAAVWVGEKDMQRDDQLNTSQRIDVRQGTTRMERGRRWIAAMTEAATMHGLDTHYSFQMLSNAGHSFQRCITHGGLAGRVFDFLFSSGPPRRDAVVELRPLAVTRATPVDLSSSSASSDGSPSDLSAKPRILIVDDEASILFAMYEYFSDRNFHVDCAKCRPEAESLLQESAYDVLISDLRLEGGGGMQGLDVVASAHERDPAIRSIVLTAHGNQDVERRARRAGANVFLQKPKPLHEIASVIDGLLGAGGERTDRTA